MVYFSMINISLILMPWYNGLNKIIKQTNIENMLENIKIINLVLIIF